MTQDSSATVEAVEFLEAIRQREVQMQGAALSLRNWYDMEVAYNALRDKIDAEMIRLRRASLNTPADKPNSATMVKVADQFLRHRGLLEEYNHWLATGGEMLTTQAVEPEVVSKTMPHEFSAADRIRGLVAVGVKYITIELALEALASPPSLKTPEQDA